MYPTVGRFDPNKYTVWPLGTAAQDRRSGWTYTAWGGRWRRRRAGTAARRRRAGARWTAGRRRAGTAARRRRARTARGRRTRAATPPPAHDIL